MTAQIETPNGYRKDAQGRLIPVDKIKPVDALRDELTISIINRAKALQAELRKFKADTFSEVAAFIEQSASEYGVKLGGKKGNAQLISFDGRYKVVRSIADLISFDERLQAAKALLDECADEWTEGARSEVRIIIQDAFRTDNNGNIRVSEVLRLRRYNFDDPRWLKAMDAISDALQVTGTKSYVRFYERVGDTNQYRAISLDIAGL